MSFTTNRRSAPPYAGCRAALPQRSALQDCSSALHRSGHCQFFAFVVLLDERLDVPFDSFL